MGRWSNTAKSLALIAAVGAAVAVIPAGQEPARRIASLSESKSSREVDEVDSGGGSDAAAARQLVVRTEVDDVCDDDDLVFDDDSSWCGRGGCIRFASGVLCDECPAPVPPSDTAVGVDASPEDSKRGPAFVDGSRETTIGEESFKEVVEPGRRRMYYSTGQLYWEACLVDGRQYGQCRAWHRNGILATEEDYADGIPDGKYAQYTVDGKKFVEGVFSRGVRSGRWRTWYLGGHELSSGEYKDDQMQGRWTFWNEDGTIDEERTGSYFGGSLRGR